MHEMRRSNQAMTEAEARAVLAQADYGTLATVGADGWPYVVPINHVLAGDRLYFHGATTGHKLDNLKAEQRVSYSVVTHAEVVPEKLSTTYTSVIAFGRAEKIEDEGERLQALRLIGARFCAGLEPEVEASIAESAHRVAVIRLDIERLTGKFHL